MDIETIIKENQELKALVSELQDKLKRYSNPESCQKFYEKNKEKIIQTSNERLKKMKELNPDKLKEYRRNAYLKRKEKLK
jgi:hypothetical protein